jgi:hypothetical protein
MPKLNCPLCYIKHATSMESVVIGTGILEAITSLNSPIGTSQYYWKNCQHLSIKACIQRCSRYDINAWRLIPEEQKLPSVCNWWLIQGTLRLPLWLVSGAYVDQDIAGIQYRRFPRSYNVCVDSKPYMCWYLSRSRILLRGKRFDNIQTLAAQDDPKGLVYLRTCCSTIITHLHLCTCLSATTKSTQAPRPRGKCPNGSRFSVVAKVNIVSRCAYAGLLRFTSYRHGFNSLLLRLRHLLRCSPMWATPCGKDAR